MYTQIIFSGFRKTQNGAIDVDDARLACDVCTSYDLTGLSFFNDGVFLTIIEGSEVQTEAIFEAFQDEPTLTGVHLIMKRSIQSREFKDFRIGFAHVDFSDIVPQAFKLTAQSYKQVLPDTPSPELAILTQTFARVNALAAC